jgi:ribosomal protein S18 acetylase RimI-like enzyme
MPISTLTFRTATAADVSVLTELVRSAYRGEESRAGWTTEADLLDDERIDASGVEQKVLNPDGVVLMAFDPAAFDEQRGLIACCEIVHRGDGVAYFGMFAVQPARQAGGLGRKVLAEAESVAKSRWNAGTMEMTVIAQRTELIAWYQRRGYQVTEETRAFPFSELVNGTALRDDLYFVVLAKSLP